MNEPTIPASSFLTNFVAEIQSAVAALDKEVLARVASLLFRKKGEGRTLFFLGNGGSHSIATHMACDLGKGTKISGKKGQVFYRAVALDNAAWLTAQANDGEQPFVQGEYPGEYEHGYDGIFVGQLENFLAAGDVVFAISSSGNSRNVVNALKFAKTRGAITVAMVGFDGGQAGKIADHVILVRSAKGQYGVVESVHEVVHHYIYEYLKALEGA